MRDIEDGSEEKWRIKEGKKMRRDEEEEKKMRRMRRRDGQVRNGTEKIRGKGRGVILGVSPYSPLTLSLCFVLIKHLHTNQNSKLH